MITAHRLLSSIALLMAAGLAREAAAQGEVTAQVVSIGRWRGTMRGQTISSAGDATRYSGTVEVMPIFGGRDGEVRIRIVLSANSDAGDLEWSISPGRCGSKFQFLLSPSNVPPLVVRSGGTAELQHEAILSLNTQANYQVPVFRGGHLQQSMVACANLKFEMPR